MRPKNIHGVDWTLDIKCNLERLNTTWILMHNSEKYKNSKYKNSKYETTLVSYHYN